MIGNYLKIAFRNIFKHKGYSFINITGLALGMAVCILIFLWVLDELSFDRFHDKVDQIFRVTLESKHADGEISRIAPTPWPLGDALVKDYPEVINFTRFQRMQRRLMISGEKRFFENGVYVADPGFFKMFSFPFIKGDPNTALTEPDTIVITERIAKKYFGDQDPIGKTINSNNKIDFVVTGVLKDIPHNSYLQFDFLVPFEHTLKNSQWKGYWYSFNYHTFILLSKNASANIIGGKIYEYLHRLEPQTAVRFRLQPLIDIHLRSNFPIDLYGQSYDRTPYIYIFSLIAVFILVIACINFVNLTTAQASKRFKEVGLRKVMGARRKDLIFQFYLESILLIMIALCFAIVFVFFILPVFNNLTGKELTANFFSNLFAEGILFFIVLLAGVLAGSYPALIQSSYQPAKILKGITGFTGDKPGGGFSRRVLVVFQFTLSIILIISTIVVSNQLNYIQNKNLGYDKKNVIYFIKRANIDEQYDAFKERLLKISGVKNVTTSSDDLTYTIHSTDGINWEGKQSGDHLSIYQFSVDHDYFKTFNMEFVEGRDLSTEFSTDESTAYIVNETAVKAMGMKNPIGKKFKLWDRSGIIVGVVKDFNFKSLHTEIGPLVLRIDHKNDIYVMVKLKEENISGTLNDIKKVYEEFNSGYPFEYKFLDDSIDNLYDEDQKVFKIFNYFMFIALFISCLGLFGLAAFVAQMRTKEIGIRKAVGATIPSILLLLSKEFLILVGIANLFAWPISYFFINKWLQGFAYRTHIGYLVFIISGLLALFIALATVSYQSIRAAITNPVNSLRYE